MPITMRRLLEASGANTVISWQYGVSAPVYISCKIISSADFHPFEMTVEYFIWLHFRLKSCRMVIDLKQNKLS